MAIYEKTVEANVRKVVETKAYPMGSVAILEDGATKLITGDNIPFREYPQVGWSYVEEGYKGFFLSEESLNKTYRPVEVKAAA